MTVTTTTNRWSYAGNGATTGFAYNSLIFAATDLKVYLQLISTGGLTPQVLNTDYTVSGTGVPAGGTVTFLAAPSDLYNVLLIRDVPFSQETQLQDDGPLPATAVTRMIDKVTVLALQLLDRAGRALRLADADALLDMTLPLLAARADKAAAYDSLGRPTVTNHTVAELEAGADTATAQAAIATTQAGIASAQAAAATVRAAAAADALDATEIAREQAQAFRDQAAAFAAAIGFDPVVPITAADSPLNLTQADNGKFLVFAPSAGAIVVNWPEIDPVVEPYKIGYRIANTAHSVTFVPAAGDTINGAANFVATETTDGIMNSGDGAGASDDWLHIRLNKPAGNTVGVSEAKVEILPYDVPFLAGFDGGFNGEDLTVQTYGSVILGRDITIEGEAASAATAPTGAAAIFDIKKNGVTIYSTKPQFAAGATALTAGILSTTTCNAGDVLTLSCTQIGSTVKGKGVNFILKARLR